MTPKILIWDLETSGVSFKANSGFILCAGIKELGKPVKILKRDNIRPDPLNDKKLVMQIYDKLVTADVWVTHNGRWFDIRYLQSRLMKWGLPPLPDVPHFDTCELIFKKLALKASLKEAGKYLGCKMLKYDVNMDAWVRAYAGDKKALQEIVTHCIADVKLTEQVYKRLRPMAYKHPNLALISGNNLACPICGKRALKRDKKDKIAVVKKAPRYQCQRCGAWSYGPYQKTGVIIRP
jgi:uncharacterized protein YprB with RNaseH-like and TPR domain/predicted RNA-binding Zn-ribbon protein involved in translation (DUF1610 family)